MSTSLALPSSMSVDATVLHPFMLMLGFQEISFFSQSHGTYGPGTIALEKASREPDAPRKRSNVDTGSSFGFCSAAGSVKGA